MFSGLARTARPVDICRAPSTTSFVPLTRRTHPFSFFNPLYNFQIHMIEFKDLVVGQLLEVTRQYGEYNTTSREGAIYKVIAVEEENDREGNDGYRLVTLEHHGGPDPHSLEYVESYNSIPSLERTFGFRQTNDAWFPHFSVLPLLTNGQTYIVPESCFNGRMFFEAGEYYTFYHHTDSNLFPGQFRPVVNGRMQSGFGCDSEHLPSFAKVFGLGGGALLPIPIDVPLRWARDVSNAALPPPSIPISLPIDQQEAMTRPATSPAPLNPTPDLCGLVAGRIYTVVHAGGREMNGIMRSYGVGERWRFFSNGPDRWKTIMVSFPDGSLQNGLYGDSGLTAGQLPRLACIFGLDAREPRPAPVPADPSDLHGFEVGQVYTVVAVPIPDRGGSDGLTKFFDASERWRFVREPSGDATDEEGPWRFKLLTDNGIECGYDEHHITRDKLPRLARIFGLEAPSSAGSVDSVDSVDSVGSVEGLVPGQTYTVVCPAEFYFTSFLAGEQWRFSLQGGDPQVGPWLVNHLVDGEPSACRVANIDRHDLGRLAQIFGLAPFAVGSMTNGLIAGQTYSVVHDGVIEGIQFVTGESWKFSLDGQSADESNGPWQARWLFSDGRDAGCRVPIKQDQLSELAHLFGVTPSSTPTPKLVTPPTPTILYELRSRRGARPRRFSQAPVNHPSWYEIDPTNEKDPYALPY